MKKKLTYNEARIYVRNGGDLLQFSRAEIERLCELALNTHDKQFHTKLQTWYDLKKKSK